MFIFVPSFTIKTSVRHHVTGHKMVTTIDNNKRVFLVKRIGYFTSKAFCNLKDIPNVLAEICESNDEFEIYEYYNDKLKKCSKKHLNEMFKANQVDFKL